MRAHEFTFDERMNAIHSRIKKHCVGVMVQSCSEAIDLLQRASCGEGIPIDEYAEAVYIGHWDDLKVRDVSFDFECVDGNLDIVTVNFTVPPTRIDAISKRDEHVFVTKTFSSKE